VGRKFNMFGCQVYGQETQLSETFDSFCHSIRPLPLAAAHNKDCVFGRTTTIIAIQSKMISFRGKYSLRDGRLVRGRAVDRILRHWHYHSLRSAPRDRAQKPVAC
jgi:hypothetical protein